MQIWTSYVKAFEHYRLTDRQTYTFRGWSKTANINVKQNLAVYNAFWGLDDVHKLADLKQQMPQKMRYITSQHSDIFVDVLVLHK